MASEQHGKPRRGARGRLAEAIIELAGDMRQVGIIDEARHDEIVGPLENEARVGWAASMSGDEVRHLRQKAKLSQSTFASYLNVTPGYVSQLERGVKKPTGAALALLNVIRRKGIEVVQ